MMFLTRLPLLRSLCQASASLSSPSDQSLFQELWEYFTEKYFSVKLEDYDYHYISPSGGTLFSLRGVVIAILLGVIVAAALSLFQKRTLGEMVRALSRNGCNAPDKAMTLAELGLLRAAAIKENLRRGSSLRRVVRCVEQEAYEAAQREKREAFLAGQSGEDAKDGKEKSAKWRDIPYTYDFANDHFYIPEDLRVGAEIQFDKKGSHPILFVLTILVCIVLAAVVCWLIPEMLKLTDNFIGLFR